MTFNGFHFLRNRLSSVMISFSIVIAFIFTSTPLISSSPPPQEELPVVILGSGVGALTSSIYLQRAGIPTLIIEGKNPGGALTQSAEVRNWPGIIQAEGITLIETMRHQAGVNGAQLLPQEVVSVDFSKTPLKIITREVSNPEKTHELQAQACIVALGSQPKLLNVPGESDYWTKGVYSCAVCDGTLYKGKTVAVVGGGDSAILEADYLSKIAEKVYLIVRSDKFKTTEVVRKENLLTKENVSVLYNTEIKEVKGNNTTVTHLNLSSPSGSEELLPIDAVFVAIGSTPNSSLFTGQLKLDEQGYIILEKDQATSAPGVYAIGDVVDPFFKQAISAAGDGSKAALQIEHYLASHQLAQKKSKKETILQDKLASEPSANTSSALSLAPTPKKDPAQISSEPALKKTAYDSGKAPELTSTNDFYEAIGPHPTPLVVDFYSPYCGPCRRLSPEFDAISQTYQGKIRFLKVNVSQFSELASNYNVYGVPKILVFDRSGKLVQEATGLDQIRALFKTLGDL